MLSFLDYIVERHAARVRRVEGKPAPWSEDPVIGGKFLCSVFRDHDRTSMQAKAYVLGLPEEKADAAVRAFRWVNKVSTVRVLVDAGLSKTSTSESIEEVIRSIDTPLNANAYKINTKGSGAAGSLWNLTGIAKAIAAQVRVTSRPTSARSTVSTLAAARGSYFICYQTMQDLRWLYGPYTDELTWAYIGVGAIRGYERQRGVYQGMSWEDRAKKTRVDGQVLTYQSDMFWKEAGELLVQARSLLGDGFTMFELEHNLCEWDKYCRISTGESKGKTFRPRPHYPFGGA